MATQVPEPCSTKSKRDWRRWDGGETFSCERCGEIYKMTLPASLTIASAVAKAFMKDHRRCKPKPDRVTE